MSEGSLTLRSTRSASRITRRTDCLVRVYPRSRGNATPGGRRLVGRQGKWVRSQPELAVLASIRPHSSEAPASSRPEDDFMITNEDWPAV